MTNDEAMRDNQSARAAQINGMQGLIGQRGQEAVRGCLTSRSDNAITYMRQRRKELAVKLAEADVLRREAEQIDKALAALGDEP